MNSNIIPEYFGNIPASKPGESPAETSDSLAAFAKLLLDSLDRERTDVSSSEFLQIEASGLASNLTERHYQITVDPAGPTLDLLEGTTDFDSLGVLILRAVNQAQQALAYSEQSQSSDNLRPEHIMSNEITAVAPNDAAVDGTEFNISNSVESEMKVNLSVASLVSSVSVVKAAPIKAAVSPPQEMKNISLPSLMNQRVTSPSNLDVESTKFSTVNLVEDAAEARNSEIEVNVFRGELGLVIQIATSSMPVRLLKALEQRLTRLVEQSGEKIERIEFKSLGAKPVDPIFSVLERATNGSD